MKLDFRLVAGLAICLFCSTSRAGNWFAIAGDRGDPHADATELDTASIGRRSDRQRLLFRVTLAKPRQDADGESFQSYLSTVLVECSSGSIFHEEQLRYRDAQWSGPVRREVFPPAKPMAFGGLVPDPRERILAAACRG
ncbi:hypothetical protein GT347_04050 [Xylophilus rhododendri]|uniref:Uncharacterized protein n=1 Tax=Xylophilus rhododendri TaxID=2697032 RepID=A0A857J2C1_9BURK|nr:hypothetical protein [Xylophilus rhododendri]QHI97222.1 hypothetical protein GT347_04050 [Xylophilus rhododendri]